MDGKLLLKSRGKYESMNLIQKEECTLGHCFIQNTSYKFKYFVSVES